MIYGETITRIILVLILEFLGINKILCGIMDIMMLIIMFYRDIW